MLHWPCRCCCCCSCEACWRRCLCCCSCEACLLHRWLRSSVAREVAAEAIAKAGMRQNRVGAIEVVQTARTTDACHVATEAAQHVASEAFALGDSEAAVVTEAVDQGTRCASCQQMTST